MNNNVYFQRKPEVLKRFGFSKSTLHNRINQNKFVPAISIGDRSVAWISSEVDAVIAAMAAGKSDDELKALVANLVSHRQQLARGL
jgi:prophage regulatory protein